MTASRVKAEKKGETEWGGKTGEVKDTLEQMRERATDAGWNEEKRKRRTCRQHLDGH